MIRLPLTWPSLLVRASAVVLGLARVVVAVIAGLAVWSLKPAAPSAPRPVTRFTITLPPGAVDFAHPACADGSEDPVWAEASARNQGHEDAMNYTSGGGNADWIAPV